LGANSSGSAYAATLADDEQRAADGKGDLMDSIIN
jgi:hypothetical protein